MARRGPEAPPSHGRPLSARGGRRSGRGAPGPVEDGRTWYVADADSWLARSGSLPPSSARRRGNTESEPQCSEAFAEKPPLHQHCPADQASDAIDANQDGAAARSEFARAAGPAQAQVVPTRPSSARLPPGPSRHRGAAPRPCAAAASPRGPPCPPEAHAPAECRAASPLPRPGEASCATREPSCSRSGAGDLSSRGVSPESHAVSFPEVAPVDLGELPPFIHKVIDSVVAEEVEGLGECLNICAQRSRTLKLLGFQHLHFDARLQAFLQTRAPGVVRPVTEAAFLAKAFLAFRAATEQSFLWRWLECRQHRLRAAVAEAADLGAASRAAAQRASDQLDHRLALFQVTLLHMTFAGWRQSVLETRVDELQRQLDEATSSSQQAALHGNRAAQAAQALRDRIGRQCEDMLGAASSQLLLQCMTVWRGASVVSRHTKLQKARMLGLATDSSELLLQRCLAAWASEADEAKRRRTAEQTSAQLSRELREKKAQSLLHFSSSVMKLGTQIDVCFMNWHLVATKAKVKVRAKNQILHTMAACDEPLKMLAFTAWQSAMDAIKQEWAGRAANKEKQLAGIVMSLMSCDKALTVTAMHSWHTVVEISRKLKMSKKHHLAHALRGIDGSSSALLAHGFHSWRHGTTLQQRKRLLEDRRQLEAVTSAMQQRSQAWRHKHDDVLNWKFAFLGGQCRSACFSSWRGHVQSQQMQRRCRRRELEVVLHRMTVMGRMLLLQCFRAFIEELAQGRHERELGEATRTLEMTGTHLQELKLASELENENQRQKTLTALSRHFTKSGQELLRWYLSRWVSVHVAEASIAEEAGKRKAQTMSQTLSVIMRTNQAFICLVVSSWSRAAAQEKYQRALEASNRHLSEKTGSAAEWVACAHEKVLRAFQKQFASTTGQLLGACLSSWQDAMVHRHARRDKKDQNMLRGLHKIRLYEGSLKTACLQSWSSVTVSAQRERQLEDAKQRLEDTSRHLEERTRHLEDTRRRLEEVTAVERREQARKREARMALVSRQLVRTIHERKHSCLVAWHNAVHAARHARAQRVQHMSIAKGSMASSKEATLLLQCLSSWVRAAMAEKHGRVLDDAHHRLQFCSASAEEDAARQRQRMMETLQRQFDMLAWQLVRSCVDQWKCCLQEAHSRQGRKDLSLSTARYRIEGDESALLSQCVAFWVGAALKGRFEKATAESYSVFRAAALKRNRMAAIRISKLLRRLLLGQCIAGWRLAMRLSVQLTEDRRRFMRCAMLGRAYISRLRGKITEQAAWLRWRHYWQTHSKAGLGWKEAQQEKREFSMEPPAQFLRPASARARVFSAQGPVPAEAMQRKMADAPRPNGSDCAIEVSAGWKQVHPSHEDDLFSKVDVNGDGVVSREEFERFVEASERYGHESMQQNEGLESVVVLAPAAVVVPASARPLAPSDRRALANRAMVSERSYHALLELNRRELREGGKSSVPARDAGWGSWAA